MQDSKVEYKSAVVEYYATATVGSRVYNNDIKEQVESEGVWRGGGLHPRLASTEMIDLMRFLKRKLHCMNYKDMFFGFDFGKEFQVQPSVSDRVSIVLTSPGMSSPKR